MEHRFDEMYSHGDRQRGPGFLLPMLFIPLTIGLMMKFASHRHHFMQGQHRSEWENGVPPVFAELHRRAHAAEAQKAAAEEKTQ